MPKVLVVDDSAVDCRLVEGILKSKPSVKVTCVANGRAALAQMDQAVPDVVITDLLMPEMDGLQLVAAVRERCPRVPVILITSKGSEETAVKALEKGAASYVPKSRLTDRLVSTVEQVLELTEADNPYRDLLECLGNSRFTFTLDSRLLLIPQLVDLIQRVLASMGVCDSTESIRLSLALEEALLNALIHGNLELTAEVAKEGFSPKAESFKTRSSDPAYRDRRIHVAVELSKSKAVFVVRDEGPGFAVSTLPDPSDLSQLHANCGRGLRLMRTFMDEVTYNNTGNEVTMVKSFQSIDADSDG